VVDFRKPHKSSILIEKIRKGVEGNWRRPGQFDQAVRSRERKNSSRTPKPAVQGRKYNLVVSRDIGKRKIPIRGTDGKMEAMQKRDQSRPDRWRRKKNMKATIGRKHQKKLLRGLVKRVHN